MQKQKNNGIKKYFFQSALTLSFVLFTVLPTPAYAWGDAIPAAILKQAMEKMYDNIQGVILGNLKMMAVRILNREIAVLVGGVNGTGVLYIENWQQYLYQMPAQQNQLYLNDLLSQTTRGKCSGVNFQSVSSGKLGSNYFTLLCNQARLSSQGSLFRVNIDEYSTDPIRSLAEGDWRVFNAMFSNPANNPIGYSMMIENARQQDLNARIEAAKAEGVANQGYNSVKVGGVTVTPGRTIGDIIANVETLGNNLIMAAKDPAEFLGNVVVAAANQAVNQLLQRGFAQAEAAINRSLDKVNQQIYQASAQIRQTVGPAAQYLGNVNQALGTVNNTVSGLRSPGTPAASSGFSCGTTSAGDFGGC